ncbi:MAG: lysophospholipid acyltransferase family protein [Candidatus Omnitrophota bacterium]|nr:lysophospholipid acyltransferase family protein [Candidatus Omnitrophota bacterium]
MRSAQSILIWAASAVITMAAFLASWLLSLMPIPAEKREKLVHAQCFWWADVIIALNPYWKLSVTGLENIDPSETYVIVANHQSLADIAVIYKTRLQFKWVAKESLLKIPFIGGLLWVNNHIMLSRGRFGSIKEVYRRAEDRLKNGKSMLFFPEGTRSATDEMNKFQSGAFKLAIKQKKPILPVFIGGTREAIPKGGWIFKTKVFGRLVVLPPIDTAGYEPGDYAKLRDLVRDKLNKLASAV